MILVTGAAGHLGTATIHYLLKDEASRNIVGLVRDEVKTKWLKGKGVGVRVGDYMNKSSLKTAMDGINTLVLISSSSLIDRITQHGNAIEAAREAGVQHIVYTSVINADNNESSMGQEHWATEKLLKGSGMSYTIFRNAFYLDLLPALLGNAVKNRQWNFPGNGHKLNMALREEIGEALAIVAANPHLYENKVLEISSNTSYSFNEIARIVSSVTHSELEYNDITINQFEKDLHAAAVPQEIVGLYVGIAAGISSGKSDYIDNALEKILHRRPKDIGVYVSKTMGERKAAPHVKQLIYQRMSA